MGKWEMVRLGDAATFVNGFAFKPADWTNEGLPIIRIQNLTGSSDIINYYDKPYGAQYELNDGDILISWSASLGVYEWNKGKALLNQHIFKVVFDKLDYDKRFFMYVIEQKLSEMSSVTHGSTMKHITKKYFDAILVPLPPLPVQQQIADALDRASALIEKRKAQIEKLNLLVKSQFIEMFGNRGCDSKPLSDIAVVIGGLTKNSSQKVQGKSYPFLRVANVYSNDFDLTEMHNITVDDNKVNRVLLNKGDLLFVEGNGSPTQIGRVAVWDGQIQPCVHQNHLIKVRFAHKINPIYAMHYFMSPLGRKQIVRLASSTSGLYTLNLKKIGSLELPIPPLNLQNEFAAFVHQVESQKSLLQQSLAKLEQNYKSLLQKCFRGEIF
ncbi:restriction endonuclease subunit S [Ruminococcaceae bacterium OttesenSCG-928-L11]|nr:restriction endonuclease subunit S [Ruminococcaceae bacterium OttesenSCG-928-L11]